MIKVRLECDGSWVSEDDIEVTNVEEDIQGRDVVAFDCPRCGETHTSLRVGRG